MQKEKIHIPALNNMDLKDARAAMIQNLIIRWNDLDKEVDKLSKSLVEYEEKLKAAREDGDTSENSAYEQAINNLSTTIANIFKTQKLKYDMSLIKEPEFVIATGTDNYIDVIDTIKNTSETSAISQIVSRYFGGDLNKIATCTRDEMKKLMAMVNYIVENASEEINYSTDDQEIVEILKEVTYSYKVRPYKPCGKVVLYSAVRVLVNDLIKTFIICPDDVSYVYEGIIASNCELASNLLNGRVGDSNTIREGLKYTILEIY